MWILGAGSEGIGSGSEVSRGRGVEGIEPGSKGSRFRGFEGLSSVECVMARFIAPIPVDRLLAVSVVGY